MKKTTLLLAVSTIAIGAFAQTDTVKKTTSKQPAPKVRMVGGAQMSSANDMFTNLSKSKDHTIFISLINAAGIIDAFKDPSIITVLAPTNDAFKKLQPGVIDTLLKPAHQLELGKLLVNYMLPGKVLSTDIAKQIKAGNGTAILTTMSGSILKAHINSDRNIVLTDGSGKQAVISQFDIAQSSGLVDVLNAPLSFGSN